MSLTTSSVTPLIIQTSRNYQDDRNRMIVSNPYETVIREPSTRVIRNYVKPSKPTYRYSIEQVSFILNLSDSSIPFRKENRIVAVNGVAIGVPVIAKHVVVAIKYLHVHYCSMFSLDYSCFLCSLHY